LQTFTNKKWSRTEELQVDQTLVHLSNQQLVELFNLPLLKRNKTK
jgi:hypothetical protein